MCAPGRASSTPAHPPASRRPTPRTWDSTSRLLRICIPVWLLCFAGETLGPIWQFLGLRSSDGDFSAMSVTSGIFAWVSRSAERQRAVGVAMRLTPLAKGDLHGFDRLASCVDHRRRAGAVTVGGEGARERAAGETGTAVR